MSEASKREATAEEIQRATEQGKESALADHRNGFAKWPMGGSLGLSGRHIAIHAAWVESKTAALIALGYQRA